MNANSRAEASRLNGTKSQGPLSESGKAISAKNSFKHGLYAKHAVLNEEDAAALETLRHDLRSEHQPINNTEAMLVEELAMNYWSINRYRAFEVNALNSNAAMKLIVAVQRFLTSAQRAFHRNLKELQSLQKQRGFVPQNADSAAQPVAPTCKNEQPAKPEPVHHEQDWRAIYERLSPKAKAYSADFNDEQKKRLALNWQFEKSTAA